MIAFDRKEFREQIADEDPDELRESLEAMHDGCAELARELKLTLPEVIEMATEAYARAHDKEVTHFECTEDDTGDGHSTVTVMADKWRMS